MGTNRRSDGDIAAIGPTVLNPQTSEKTFELNSQLQPTERARVFADVKDFQAPVRNVRLHFVHIPLDIKMKRLTGSIWETELSPNRLQELAVGGETMRYDALILARDRNGKTSVNTDPLRIAVKAPAPSKSVG